MEIEATVPRVASSSGDDGGIDWSTLLDAIPNIFGIYDSQLRLVFLNRAGRSLFGKSLRELVGRRDTETLPTQTTAAYWPLLERALTTRQAVSSDRPTVLPGTKPGEYLLCTVTYLPILTGSGEVRAIVGVTNSLLTETLSEAETRQFRAFVGDPLHAMATLGPDGTVLTWSAGAERLSGYSANVIVGKRLPTLVLEIDWTMATVWERISCGESVEFEAPLCRQDSTVVEALVAVTPIRDAQDNVTAMAALVRDISHVKNIGRRLHQLTERDAAASIAAGIAHDINNVLAIMQTYTELLSGGPLTATQQNDLTHLRAAARRGAALTRPLLSLHDGRDSRTAIYDLNEIVRGIDDLLRRVIGEGITLTTVLSPSPVKVESAPGAIDRILLNLVLNARDAMPDGGTISVTVGYGLAGLARPLDGRMIRGAYASLSVEDTGLGMSEETQYRIFEPFFSTKSPDKGRGLGLWIVQQAVRDLQGELRVQSELGKGTAFHVHLPLSSSESSLEPSA